MSNKAIIANATLFKDSDGEFEYRIGWVPLSELVIDPNYQRNPRTYKKLMNGYNPRLCDPILVSYRPEEDKFYIIDGNHRAEVARKKGKEIVVCKILEGMSAKDEANEFANQDACRVKLTPYDRYKAALAGENPVALELHRILDEYGIRVVPTNPYQSPRCLCCLSYAWNTLRTKHVVWLRWVLDVFKKAKWHDIKGAYNEEWVTALTNIYVMYGGRVDVQDVLIKSLRKTNPHDVKVQAKVRFPSFKSSHKAIEQCLIEMIETEGKWTTLENMLAGD